MNRPSPGHVGPIAAVDGWDILAYLTDRATQGA